MKILRRTIARLAAPAIAIVALLVVAQTASAQELRGTVRDSTSAGPVPGAVLLLLDASGAVLGRNITSERGDYRVALSPEMRRVRFIRIGFRPREAAIPALDDGVARLDMRMLSLATMLEPVVVAANPHCPRRKDADAAFALLDQARAGLLATIVARDAKPSTLVRFKFDREFDDDRITYQRVQKDSATTSANSFSSVRTAREFISDGFLVDSGYQATFLGPDAEVLLDEGFTSGYCFRVADSDRTRPTQIGLTFSPAERRRGRVDINGTLWIDTVARALRGIDYQYLGLDPATSSVRPGGHTGFREMPNGVVLIDRWTMRLPKRGADTVTVRLHDEIHDWFRPIESGGELAHAVWRDGFTWNASLGAVRGEAHTEGGAVAERRILALPGTPYRTMIDSTGHFEISDLLPGPYSLVAIDSDLARIGIAIPIADSIVAVRDSVVHKSLTVRTPRRFVGDRCLADRKFQPGSDAPYLIGRAVSADGSSVDGLVARLRDVTPPDSSGQVIAEDYHLGSNGIFHWCRNLVEQRTIAVEVYQRGSRVGSAVKVVGPTGSVGVIVVPVTLRPR